MAPTSIKVEPPAGDETRLSARRSMTAGEAAYFGAVNRGKRAHRARPRAARRARRAGSAARRTPTCWSRIFCRARWSAGASAMSAAVGAPSAADLLRHLRLRRRRPARRAAGLRRGAAGDVRADEHQRHAGVRAPRASAFRSSTTSRDTMRSPASCWRWTRASAPAGASASRSTLFDTGAQPAGAARGQLALFGPHAGPARQRPSQHRALRQIRRRRWRDIPRHRQRRPVPPLLPEGRTREDLLRRSAFRDQCRAAPASSPRCAPNSSARWPPSRSRNSAAS